MTGKSFKTTISASFLGVAFLGVSSITSAGQYDLWREQVQTTPGERTILADSIRQGRVRDYSMWREQRGSKVAAGTHIVYVANTSHSRYQPGSDYRPWRYQVQRSGKVVIEDLALHN